jgi:hypothetical protein
VDVAFCRLTVVQGEKREGEIASRAFPDPASIRVRTGNGQALVQFPTTGGWGFENEQWHYGEIRLEGLPAGRHTLELTSTARDSNLNTDGLFVSDHPVLTCSRIEIHK